MNIPGIKRVYSSSSRLLLLPSFKAYSTSTSTKKILIQPSPTFVNMHIQNPDRKRKFDHNTPQCLPESAVIAIQTMYNEDMGDQIKSLETSIDQYLDPTIPYIIRLDGVSFSNFLRGLPRPFDVRINTAMVNTARDLVSNYMAYTGYVQSDEISLVFPRAMTVQEMEDYKKWEVDMEEWNKKSRKERGQPPRKPIHRCHNYSGRQQKLVSTLASFTSVRFNYHLSQQDWSDLPEKTRNKMLSNTAIFDARIVPCKTEQQAMETIFWRSHFDGLRNAIRNIGRLYFREKELLGVSVPVLCKRLLSERNVNPFLTYPAKHIWGVWVKKELFELKDARNPVTGELVPNVMRGRVRVGSFNWADWDEESRVAFTFAKYWTDVEHAPPMAPLEGDVGGGGNGEEGNSEEGESKKMKMNQDEIAIEL